MEVKSVSTAFHEHFYDSHAWETLHWRGLPILKSPMDLHMYQEILWECDPTVVVETGTYRGGSAAFLADTLASQAAARGKAKAGRSSSHTGHVITIDHEDRTEGQVDAQTVYFRGDSTAATTVATVTTLVKALWASWEGSRVMVILDSDHSKAHVLAELDAYAPLVTRGQYLIVEDTNLNGHPVLPHFGAGPYEAVEEWLPKHPEFERDVARERLLISHNPGGYLRRVTQP